MAIQEPEELEELCAVPACSKPAVTTVTIEVRPLLGPDHEPAEQKYVPLCAEHAEELREIGVEAFEYRHFR